VLVDAALAHGRVSDEDLEARIKQGLSLVGISENAMLFVRSSGSEETMRDRGRLFSERATAGNVGTTIRYLAKRLASFDQTRVHWIVQEWLEPKVSGHLSNERRTSYDSRDWLLEVEPRDGLPGYCSSIAVRKWRNAAARPELKLSCAFEMRISLCLRRVAMWAAELRERIHFEWVWDGSDVLLMQADIADAIGGVDPARLLPERIPSIDFDELGAFRVATTADMGNYRKLQNARLYSELGYSMPPFFIIDDEEILSAVLSGSVPEAVLRDLDDLTKRPLILRTDGHDIPAEQREMLPRSDELRSAAAAVGWMTHQLSEAVRRCGLRTNQLVIIGHHFIPSVASAWARAEPGRTIVRIESLWGVPEGLYWFSHDTFEVDTGTVELSVSSVPDGSLFRSWERRRFKGTFIASDREGRWVPYRAAVPFDWRKSIRNKRWLVEIAFRTRQIAERAGFPVSVMWFVGNHPGATAHAVLPWYHSRSEMSGLPKAAPRRKWRTSRDFKIETERDWIKLRELLAEGRRIERVVVEPVEPTLIRNREFAEELGGLACTYSFVVELSGGILSHAYYILQRAGANVECVDLFGADEDVAEYNKVVRDKIADSIVRRGERVDTVQLTDAALVIALKQKLVEEALEALDSRGGDELVGELADVLEVVRGICSALGVPLTRVVEERNAKRVKRGGFDKGLMLIRTSTPHSIPRPSAASRPLSQGPYSKTVVIARPEDIPTKDVYRKPDLRQPDEQELEKMLTVESDLLSPLPVRETLGFSLAGESSGTEEFTLTLELRRIRGTLRTVVRLRRIAFQLELGLPGV